MKCWIGSSILWLHSISGLFSATPLPSSSSQIGDLVPRAAPVSHYSHWWFSNRLLSSLAIVLSLPYCLQLVPTYIYLQQHGLSSAPLLAHLAASTHLISAAPFLLSLPPLQTQHKRSLSTVRCFNDFVLSRLIHSICQGGLQGLFYLKRAFTAFKSNGRGQYFAERPSFVYLLDNIECTITIFLYLNKKDIQRNHWHLKSKINRYTNNACRSNTQEIISHINQFKMWNFNIFLKQRHC